MDTITEATATPVIQYAPTTDRPPLEPLDRLVARLAADALTHRRPGGYSLLVDLCVDMDGAISIEDAAGLGATAYQREICVHTVGVVPHEGDMEMASATIESELLAGTDDSPSILAIAARLRGSDDLVELAYARQVSADAFWHVDGRLLPSAVVERAVRLRGVEGSRLIAAYAWSALGYPADALIHIVPALSSPLPVVRFGVHEHALDPIDEESAWYSPITAFRALTRRDSLAALPSGSDPIAQEIYLSRTTGERAESRRRSAAAALCQYVLDETWSGSDRERLVRGEIEAFVEMPTALTEAQRRTVGVIAALEVHGIGGPGGYAGDATARMSWATALGKGRRQATDGEAWTAAIGALAVSVGPEDLLAALPDIRHVDLEWPMSYALAQVQVVMTYDAALACAWGDVARAVYARATADDAPYTDGGAVALGRRYGADRSVGAS